MKNLARKWWFLPLVIGIAVRLILMPTTLHVDILGHSFTSYFFAYEGKLDPYQTLADLPADHPLVQNYGVTDIFIYPPLTYFTLGVFRVIIKPFVDPQFLPFLMENPSGLYVRSDLFWNLFLFKLPYLFLDVGIAFLLASLFGNANEKKLAFILWMANPLTLYATFMMGQIDILPVFFSVLALYFTKNKKYRATMICLGIGGSYKMYPLLFIIPAAFVIRKDMFNRLKLMLWGFIPFALTIVPYLKSKAFRYMVFSPKSSKMLFMKWNVSGAEYLLPFILILTLIFAYSYYSTKKHALPLYFLSILLMTYSLTHYHPQWFLWVTPFFVWQLVTSKLKYWELVTLFVGVWLVITLFFEPSLSVGLFAPINHNLLKAKGLTDILDPYTDVFQLKSIVRSVFAGGVLFYLFKLFSEEGKDIV